MVEGVITTHPLEGEGGISNSNSMCGLLHNRTESVNNGGNQYSPHLRRTGTA